MTRLFQLAKLLRRRLTSHRGNTLIMFAGLSISFTFLMVITHYVRSELSFDTFWENAENKYRLQSTITYPGGSPFSSAMSPVPFLDLIKKNFPQVKSGARLSRQTPSFRYGDTLLEETLSLVDPGFFDIFDIEMLEGTRSSILSDPRSVILSWSFARRLFTGAPATGQTFSVIQWNGEITDYQVAGIFRDLPHNSHLELSALALLQTKAEEEENWRNSRVYTYIELEDGTDPAMIENELPALEEKAIPAQGDWNIADSSFVKFHAIDRLHLFQDDSGDMKAPGSAETVYVYGLIGLLLVLIAGTNFVNTMIVQANFRVKEVALRKVYGAKWRGVLAEFLPETFIISLGAFYFAVIGLEVWGDSLFALMGHVGDTNGKEMLISGAIVAGVAVFLALFAGAYPAISLAHTRPINALRTRTASLTLSMNFSKWMMSLQFVIAIGIAIVSSAVWSQISYTQSKDLGYDPSGVFILPVGRDPSIANVLNPQISNLPGVLGVTRSLFAPTEGPLAGLVFNRLTQIKGGDGTEIPVQFAEPNFFEVYKIALLAGRVFSPDFALDVNSSDAENVNIVLNESATRSIGFANPAEAVGTRIWQGSPDNQRSLTIIGVVADNHDTSFRTSQEPITYFNGGGRFFTISIRIASGHEKDVQEAIKAIWQDILPDVVFAGEFLTDRLRAQYGPEYQLMGFLLLTGGLSILLSCLGLYATSAFLLSKQQKEFAIRKVLGASFKQTSQLALGRAVKPAILAVFFACPIAYFYLEDWLEGFVYRIDMPYEMFIFASFGMVLVAICSVYMVVYRVSNRRMVELLNEE